MSMCLLERVGMGVSLGRNPACINFKLRHYQAFRAPALLGHVYVSLVFGDSEAHLDADRKSFGANLVYVRVHHVVRSQGNIFGQLCFNAKAIRKTADI